MSLYVPGYGTFDPGLPEWLELRTDGTLHNRNASDPNIVWRPPPGWTGGGGLVFTPEGSTPLPPTPPAPPPPGPALVLLRQFLAAMRAVVAHDNEMVALAQQRLVDDTARLEKSLRLAAEAVQAFDALLADFQAKTNVQ